MIHAFHGFLGLPRDWDLFESAVQDHRGRPVRWVKHNLWQEFSNLKDKSLQGWALALNEEIEFEREVNDLKPPLLVGYSMGGRLAMHTLLGNPQNWSGAVFISAHPGLRSEEEREARHKNDLQWSERWRSEKWSEVWKAWQSQPVFKTTASPAEMTQKTEREFDRELLADAMANWSLSHQEDLLEPLLKIKKPVLWLAGDEDNKFKVIHVENANRAARDGRTLHKFELIEDAGHRLPWEKPESFLTTLQRFIESTSL